MGGTFSFLGGADGTLLPAGELAVKLGVAQDRFNAVSTPDEAHEATRGMTPDDVREIFERCAVNHGSTMRIFGARPQSVPLQIVRTSAAALAESANEDHQIPPDIELLVRCHAEEVLRRRMVGSARV